MKSDARWRLSERVFSAVAKTLAPGATVTHNARLPVIGSPSGRRRQCDVAIWAGDSADPVLTIVEVQSRKDRPEITLFDGWVAKMHDVGAQHLICVSEAGFPASIKEKALQIGPCVRLVLLKDLLSHEWPSQLAAGGHELRIIQVSEPSGLRFTWKLSAPELSNLNPNDELFSRSTDGPAVSLAEALGPTIAAAAQALPPGQTTRVKLEFRDSLYFGHAHEHQLTGIDATFPVRLSLLRIPVRVAEYIQDPSSTRVAWLLAVDTELEGKPVAFRTPLVPIGDGDFRAGPTVTSGLRLTQNAYTVTKRVKRSAN